MNEQEIIEGNKLIAEFMNSSFLDKDDYAKQVNCPIDEMFNMPVCNCFYHSSWDWLMPVVQKCIKYCHDNMLEEWEQSFSDKFMICDIKALFNEVVKFIKWYNNLKK